jgi:hypothetical protein
MGDGKIVGQLGLTWLAADGTQDGRSRFAALPSGKERNNELALHGRRMEQPIPGIERRPTVEAHPAHVGTHQE